MSSKNAKPPKGRKKPGANPRSVPNAAPAPRASIWQRLRERHSLFLSRLWKVIVGAGVIAGIVAGVVGVLQYQHQKEVDERDGKLSGQLLLSLGDNGPPLNQNVPTYFFFAMPKDREDARYAIPIPLTVANTSNVSDDLVNLVLSYDRKYFRSLLPKEFLRPSPRRPTSEQHFEMSSNGTYDYAKYALTFLSPHDSESFADGAFATYIPRDPQAPMLFSSGIGLDVTARTYSKRDIPRDWEIRFRGLRVSDDAGVLQVMTDWYAKEVAFAIREKAGFWGYIPKLIFKDEVVMYGFAPDFQLAPQGNVFIPKGMPKTFYAYRVKPYHWKLLFDFS